MKISDLLNKEELFTAEKAEIIFANGDIYKGRVVKGKMETEQTEVSTYQTISTGVIYKGPFKDGERDGKGILLIPLKNYSSQFSHS